MSERKEIRISRETEVIRMPLIKGDYYNYDIGVMKSSTDNEIHIFCNQYREVKCGRGKRKADSRSDGINIPFEILDEFIEAIQKARNF